MEELINQQFAELQKLIIALNKNVLTVGELAMLSEGTFTIWYTTKRYRITKVRAANSPTSKKTRWKNGFVLQK